MKGAMAEVAEEISKNADIEQVLMHSSRSNRKMFQ